MKLMLKSSLQGAKSEVFAAVETIKKKFGFAKGRIDEAISQIVSLGCVSCNVRFFNSIFLCFFEAGGPLVFIERDL